MTDKHTVCVPRLYLIFLNYRLAPQEVEHSIKWCIVNKTDQCARCSDIRQRKRIIALVFINWTIHLPGTVTLRVSLTKTEYSFWSHSSLFCARRNYIKAKLHITSNIYTGIIDIEYNEYMPYFLVWNTLRQHTFFTYAIFNGWYS